MENPPQRPSCRFCGQPFPPGDLDNHESQCRPPSTFQIIRGAFATRFAAITSAANDAATNLNEAAASFATNTEEMAKTAKRFAAFTAAVVVILTMLDGWARDRNGQAANCPNAGQAANPPTAPSSATRMAEFCRATATLFSQLETIAKFMADTNPTA